MKVEEPNLLFEFLFQQVGEHVKLFGAMVGGSDIPVEVILIEYTYNVMIFDKGNLFFIEGSKIARWQVRFVGMSFTYGNYELHERCIDVFRVSCFSFCP